MAKYRLAGQNSWGDFTGPQKYFGDPVKQRYEISPVNGKMGHLSPPQEGGPAREPLAPREGGREDHAAEGREGRREGRGHAVGAHREPGAPGAEAAAHRGGRQLALRAGRQPGRAQLAVRRR